MPFEVKNEIAIITGSAQGFGKEFAKRLLQKGAKVCISDVNEEQGLKTIEELGKAYVKDGVTFKRYVLSMTFFKNSKVSSYLSQLGICELMSGRLWNFKDGGS